MKIYNLFFLLVMLLFFSSCDDTKEYKVIALQGTERGKYFSELFYDACLVIDGDNVYTIVDGKEKDTAHITKRESFDGGFRFQVIDEDNDAYVIIIDEFEKKLYIQSIQKDYAVVCEIE